MGKRRRTTGRRRSKTRTRRTRALLGVVAGLLVLTAGGAALLGGGEGSGRTVASDADQLEVGRQVYAENCAACHGPNGEGQQGAVPAGQAPAPPHDPTGHTWHHPDAQLFQIVKFGGTMGMPAYKDTLTDDEIWAVLDYIKTFWTPEQREFQAQR